jgi:hypothetical protein
MDKVVFIMLVPKKWDGEDVASAFGIDYNYTSTSILSRFTS